MQFLTAGSQGSGREMSRVEPRSWLADPTEHYTDLLSCPDCFDELGLLFAQDAGNNWIGLLILPARSPSCSTS